MPNCNLENYGNGNNQFLPPHGAVRLAEASGTAPAFLRRRWQREEEEILAEMYLGGAPVDEIARRLGRTKKSISARRRALGLLGHRSPGPVEGGMEVIWAIVVEMKKAGRGNCEIARDLAIKPSQAAWLVEKARRKGFLPRPGRSWRQRKKEKAGRGSREKAGSAHISRYHISRYERKKTHCECEW